jgi:hypothetical protein
LHKKKRWVGAGLVTMAFVGSNLTLGLRLGALTGPGGWGGRAFSRGRLRGRVVGCGEGPGVLSRGGEVDPEGSVAAGEDVVVLEHIDETGPEVAGVAGAGAFPGRGVQNHGTEMPLG